MMHSERLLAIDINERSLNKLHCNILIVWFFSFMDHLPTFSSWERSSWIHKSRTTSILSLILSSALPSYSCFGSNPFPVFLLDTSVALMQYHPTQLRMQARIRMVIPYSFIACFHTATQASGTSSSILTRTTCLHCVLVYFSATSPTSNSFRNQRTKERWHDQTIDNSKHNKQLHACSSQQ